MNPNTTPPTPTPTTTTRRALAACALAGLAAAATPAAAQVINIDVADPTLSPGQTTTLTMTAMYPDGDYAMAGIGTEIVINQIQGDLSGLRLVAPMAGPGTSAGVLGPGGITGIIAGQLNFPTAMIYADPTNPIAFYQFDYTWDGTLSGPILLDVETRTSRFDTYIDRQRATSESRLADLVEGRAIIAIPAPTGAAAFGLLALGAATRRRR